MQDRNDLLFKLEQDIATLLVEKLEHLQITFERASQIAKFVLKNLPDNMTEEQIKSIIPSLDDEIIELAEIVNVYVIKFEEENKNRIYDEAKMLLKNGKLDEVDKLIKDYFDRRKKLLQT